MPNFMAGRPIFPLLWRWCPARDLGSRPELGRSLNARERPPSSRRATLRLAVFRYEIDLEAVASRLGEALEGTCRRPAAACLETGDDSLGGVHALSQFRLGEARI